MKAILGSFYFGHIKRILRGSHKLKGLNIGLSTDNKLSATIRFYHECLYKFGTIDDLDINKLIGLSNNIHHHKDSVRIGWRIDKEGTGIQLLPYIYENGVRDINNEEVLMTVDPYHEIKASVEITKESYIITLDNVSIDHEPIRVYTYNRSKSKIFWLKYILYPYFGGNRVSPNDMFFEFNID